MRKITKMLAVFAVLLSVSLSVKASDNVKIVVVVFNDADFEVDARIHVADGAIMGVGSAHNIPAKGVAEFEVEFGLSHYIQGNYFYVEISKSERVPNTWTKTHSFYHNVATPQDDSTAGALIIDVNSRNFESIFYYDHIGSNDYYWAPE